MAKKTKPLSAEEFAQRVVTVQLLSQSQIQKIWAEFGTRDLQLDQLQQLLLGRELLTNFQVDKLMRGQKSGFYYGDYRVLYMVGAGTFARVFRAVHKDTGEVVAVKLLRQRHCKDTRLVEQFCREGEMGRTLRHPNIVPIYEVGSQDNQHYLVLEFIEGRNLRDFLKVRKKFDSLQATELAVDMAAGLGYAFERGIAHRDLKLSNVLVSARGNAKLVDFGLAAMDESISDEALVNTPNPRTIDYAGLERATNVRRGDLRSDVYFLGCMYYNMLTGVAPLTETRDRMQRLSRKRFDRVEPIQKLEPSLPIIVTAIVNRAMDLDPDQRYQSPVDMVADLKSAVRRLKDGSAQDASAGEIGRTVRTVMVVESDVEIQDVFRDRLKRSGYRVLVIGDPRRALGRFQDSTEAAHCVIFSTDRLAEEALEAYRQFGADPLTESVPAILLLARKHLDWHDDIEQTAHRKVVSMPTKFSKLEALLGQLIASDESREKK